MNPTFRCSYAEAVVVCQRLLNALCCTADAVQTHEAKLRTSRGGGGKNNECVRSVTCCLSVFGGELTGFRLQISDSPSASSTFDCNQ